MRLALILLASLLASGCSTLGYYVQSAWGGLSLLRKDRPIDRVLKDPRSPEPLRRQLEIVTAARRFASDELQLPDNGSYRRYAEIDRPYVTWVVTATPEFSLEPVTWCFPVAGCVSYRGYFSERRAHNFASRQRARGYDVSVAGVRAFSTLGWFRDPVLSTFVFDRPADLAGLLFHELAHQKVYVRDDTRFNESFATFVETEGVRRWLTARGESDELAADRIARARERESTTLLLAYRSELAALYASPLPVDEKRAAKQAIFERLSTTHDELVSSWRENGLSSRNEGSGASREWNNADLASVEAYHQWVAAFAALMDQSRGDLDAFYSAVEEIAALPPDKRAARLQALSPGTG